MTFEEWWQHISKFINGEDKEIFRAAWECGFEEGYKGGFQDGRYE